MLYDLSTIEKKKLIILFRLLFTRVMINLQSSEIIKFIKIFNYSYLVGILIKSPLYK